MLPFASPFYIAPCTSRLLFLPSALFIVRECSSASACPLSALPRDIHLVRISPLSVSLSLSPSRNRLPRFILLPILSGMSSVLSYTRDARGRPSSGASSVDAFRIYGERSTSVGLLFNHNFCRQFRTRLFSTTLFSLFTVFGKLSNSWQTKPGMGRAIIHDTDFKN